MKRLLSVIAALITLQIAAEEYPAPPANQYLEPSLAQEMVLPVSAVTQKGTFLFGCLASEPGEGLSVRASDLGAGLSIRERTGSTGTALEYKLGMTYFGFDTMSLMPTLSVDYNFLYFFRAKSNFSPYASCGIGAVYIIPYVPLRAGLQYSSGFVDVGAKMILGFMPMPEIRAGMNIEF